MPEDRAAEALEAVETEVELRSEAVSVEAFREGDVIRAGSSELTVRHLPGHTAGHAGFVADGRLWSGDALLPGYTPNIGGADVRLENALDAYLETLQRIARFDMYTAWPGHRERIDDPIGRVRATVTHHRDRTAQVVDVLRGDGLLDVWSVAGQVFGALDGVHILHGTGEAHAHLEHLRTSGIAACDGDAYTLKVADPDLDAVFPSL